MPKYRETKIKREDLPPVPKTGLVSPNLIDLEDDARDMLLQFEDK